MRYAYAILAILSIISVVATTWGTATGLAGFPVLAILLAWIWIRWFVKRGDERFIFSLFLSALITGVILSVAAPSLGLIVYSAIMLVTGLMIGIAMRALEPVIEGWSDTRRIRWVLSITTGAFGALMAAASILDARSHAAQALGQSSASVDPIIALVPGLVFATGVLLPIARKERALQTTVGLMIIIIVGVLFRWLVPLSA